MAIGLEKAGGDFHVVFPRNAAIPNAKQIQATTSYDGQTELAMRIFQGDHEDGEQERAARRVRLLRHPTPARAGEAQVEITFDVNVEGILTMCARDPATGRR